MILSHIPDSVVLFSIIGIVLIAAAFFQQHLDKLSKRRPDRSKCQVFDLQEYRKRHEQMHPIAFDLIAEQQRETRG